MRSRRPLLLAALVAVLAFLALRPDAPGPRAGEATLELSVYSDPAHDARPVDTVVHRTAPPPGRLPNFVVIMADDLGYGDLGAYGNTLLRTPNLDRLAAGGVRMTDFYSSHSTCSPSRAGLLTGRYPLRTGINFPIQPSDDTLKRKARLWFGGLSARLGATDMAQASQSAYPGLPSSEITLAEALHVAGYATGLVGKWHLGDFRNDPAYHPMRNGFDFFVGFQGSNDEFPYRLWRNDKVVDENLGLRQGDVMATLTGAATEFIDANREKPFFLYVATKNVHTPLVPSEKFRGRSAAGPYGDSVEELDAGVGEIVQALEQRGLLDDTFVVFTSDNGPWHLGNPGLLRGRKGQPMEGGQRVPMIASWPGHLPAGRTVDAPAMNFDLFPTFLRLAGVELPEDRTIDGRDLGDLLAGRSEAPPHDALYFFNANVIDGARSGPWKFYRWVNLYTWPVPLDKPNTWTGRAAHDHAYTDPVTGETATLVTLSPLLFDVTTDRNESYNVASGHAAEAARIQAGIEAWEKDFFANPRGWKN